MGAIIITGASMGIGRALALAWARSAGATVVLSARGEAALTSVGREVEALGGRAVCIAGDVTEEAHCRELVKRAEDVGGVDVLVNNAGRGYYAPALAVDLDELRRLFELNVIAPLRLVQLSAPSLERTRGTIVMMSSVTGVIAPRQYTAYAASKFALEAMSMAIRAELSDKNIGVVVIRPGPVATPFRANAVRTSATQGFDAPDPKSQSPDEVAEITLRAVAKRTPVVETSVFVRVASAASRLAPWIVRSAIRRNATGSS